MKTLTSLFLKIGFLAAAAFVAIVFISMNPTKPTVVGKVTSQTDGLLASSYQVFEKTEKYGTLPMWQLDSPDGKPMWGFILINHIKVVDYIKDDLRMNIISHGNFADLEYSKGTWPIYAGANGFWDPNTRMFTPVEPKQFYVVVSLNDRK